MNDLGVSTLPKQNDNYRQNYMSTSSLSQVSSSNPNNISSSVTNSTNLLLRNHLDQDSNENNLDHS